MIKLSWTPEERDELRRTFESSTGEWFETALKVADCAIALFLARASGQVKDDRISVSQALVRLEVISGKYEDEATGALGRLTALAQDTADSRSATAKAWQEVETLRAKVAELEKGIANERSHTHRLTFLLGDVLTALGMQRMNPTQISMLAMGADSEQMVISRARAVVSERDTARAEMERLKARKWVQCTSVSNECLGGCASMMEHDRYRRRGLLHEVERLKAETKTLDDYVLEIGRSLRAHSGFEAPVAAATLRRAETAESRLAAIRERANSPGLCERFREEGITEGLRWVLEGDAPNPSMPSNDSAHASDCDPRTFGDVPPRVQQHEDLQRLTGGTLDPTEGSCSTACTHDDAAKVGHPERVRARSEAVKALYTNGACTCGGEGFCQWCLDTAKSEELEAAFERGAEATRAACLLAVHKRLSVNGMSNRDSLWNDLTAAIEGATP